MQGSKLHPPTDAEIERGHANNCVCGRVWYDSDGGPCHYECASCGEVCPSDGDGCDGEFCPTCSMAPCKGCGTPSPRQDLDNGLCEYCVIISRTWALGSMKDVFDVWKEKHETAGLVNIVREALGDL